MTCPDCGHWELASGDLACSWCGASHLHVTAQLDPSTLNPEDYPPPLQLHIRNDSPLSLITVDQIAPDQPWVTLLPSEPLPRAIQPGTRHTFLLDVDTFAPRATAQASVTITTRYAPNPETVTLGLPHPEPAGTDNP